MLLNNFKVSGFKVFGNAVELNMVPQTKNLRNLEENLILAGQKKILKSSLLYGGNNTGKTSLLEALSIFKKIVLRGSVENFPFDLLKNFTFNQDDIVFEISFFDDGKNYTYGIEFNESLFLGEYIYLEDELLLSRERDGFVEGILIDKHIKLKERILDLPKEKLITSYMNEYVANPEDEVFGKIKKFFEKIVFLNDAKKNVIMNNTIMDFIKDKHKMDILNKVLASTEVHVVKRNYEEESYVLNNEHYVKHIDKNNLERLKDAKLLDALRMVSYYQKADGLVAKPSILFDSIGTNKFIVMTMYIINALLNHQILFIDEIDNSLHYKITRSLLILMNSSLNHGAQFIMTTHDVKLLSQQLLRKDQINFVVRDDKVVKIVSLDNFKANSFKDIRSDSNFEKMYIEEKIVDLPDTNISNVIKELEGQWH